MCVEFLLAAPRGAGIIILGVGRQRLGWENRSGRREGSGRCAGLCTGLLTPAVGQEPGWPGGGSRHPWLWQCLLPCRSHPTLNGSCSDPAVLRCLYPLAAVAGQPVGPPLWTPHLENTSLKHPKICSPEGQRQPPPGWGLGPAALFAPGPALASLPRPCSPPGPPGDPWR